MGRALLSCSSRPPAAPRHLSRLPLPPAQLARLLAPLRRWESAAAGQPWVGQHLPAVTVDSWGKFPFVLVRLLDRSSRHKVLVRGKNGAEEGALFAQLEQEVGGAEGREGVQPTCRARSAPSVGCGWAVGVRVGRWMGGTRLGGRHLQSAGWTDGQGPSGGLSVCGGVGDCGR